MEATKLEAYLGIPMPSIEIFEKPDEKDKSRTVLYGALDDLCHCSNNIVFHLGAGMIKPEIRLLDGEARDALVQRRMFPKKHLKSCEILVISATVPQSFYNDISWSGDESNKTEVLRVLARVEFGKRISDLLVMTNVARVGAIELLHSVVVQDGETRDFSEIPSMVGWSLQRAVEVAKKMAWPRLDGLDIQIVWSWAANHRQMLEAFDGNAMGRALCAFSRLFEHKTADEPMQLLWALVGLEALYVGGKAELAQQVREKSQVLLGKQVAFKKKITQMYDFRSRFVHGDLDFPGLCMVGDARESVAKFDDELLDTIAVAAAVLVGTIQEVIRRDWAGLDFGFTVANSAKAATEPAAAE